VYSSFELLSDGKSNGESGVPVQKPFGDEMTAVVERVIGHPLHSKGIKKSQWALKGGLERLRESQRFHPSMSSSSRPLVSRVYFRTKKAEMRAKKA
jgi:hypothetical protein